MREKIIELLYAENVRSDCGIERLADEICAINSVKKGKWIKHKDGYYRCSECGSRGSAIKAHYCHHCGAMMMKGGKDEVN